MLHPTRAGGRDSQLRDLEKIPCSQACHCQTLRKTTAAGGNRGSPRPPDGPGVSRLPPPCQQLLSLPLSSWKRLPAGRPPHRHLRCPSPRGGAPGVCHRECSVPSPGRQELLSPPLLSTSSRVAFPARHRRTLLSQILEAVLCHLLQSPARRDAVQGGDGLGASGYHLEAVETVRRPGGHFSQGEFDLEYSLSFALSLFGATETGSLGKGDVTELP